MNLNPNKTQNTPNKDTNKVYTQQIFHKGLFEKKTKSNCLPTEITPQIEDNNDQNEDLIQHTNIDKTPGELNAQTERQECEETMESQAFVDIASSREICPPPWQKIPAPRNLKRKKVSTSPESLKITNTFDRLPVDEQDTDQAEPKVKKPSKPPPIILYGIEDVNKLTELIESVAERHLFSYKIINKNQMRINCDDVEAYRRIISKFRESGVIGHTFNKKDERCYRIVIRNLHHTTPHTVIKEEIEKSGNIISGEIINARYGRDKLPTSTFFVNLLPSPNNKSAKEIKYIYHQAVTIEDPRKKKTIVQCQRCQQYGHTKNYCMRPYRCVKCGQSHKTADCEKKDRNTPAQCALCEGSHPANYKGCTVYKEILARKTTKPNHRYNRLQMLDTENQKETSNPSALTQLGTSNTFSNWNHKTPQTYAEAIKNNKLPTIDNSTKEYIPSPVEILLLKQSEKFDLLLQQMSTLMSLITNLVGKLSK